LLYIICSKSFTERPKKSPLRRPICDGKYYVGKCSAEFVVQGMPKIDSSTVGIIGESTTAPCTENKCRMSVGSCNSQHAINPSTQEVSGFWLTNGGCIWSGTRHEAQ